MLYSLNLNCDRRRMYLKFMLKGIFVLVYQTVMGNFFGQTFNLENFQALFFLDNVAHLTPDTDFVKTQEI